MGLSRNERAVLRQAGEIITRELLTDKVGIPGFGLFYTSEVIVPTGLNKSGESADLKLTHVVRFRAWTQLKKQIYKLSLQDYSHPDEALLGKSSEEVTVRCPHCGEDATDVDGDCPSCGLPLQL